jgi:hypothetical protein
MGGSDYAPTESQKAVAKELHERLMTVQTQVGALLTVEAKALTP